MEKEQEQNDNFSDADKENNEIKNVNEIKSDAENKDEKKEETPEDKIKELNPAIVVMTVKKHGLIICFTVSSNKFC